MYFQVLYEGIHASKHARSPVPCGGRPRLSVSRTQRQRMKRSCYHRWKRKEKTGHRRSSLTLRRSFPLHLSCARVAGSNFSSMTRTDVQDRCITASEVLPPNNRLFYSLGASNLVQLGKKRNRIWGYASLPPRSEDGRDPPLMPT